MDIYRLILFIYLLMHLHPVQRFGLIPCTTTLEASRSYSALNKSLCWTETLKGYCSSSVTAGCVNKQMFANKCCDQLESDANQSMIDADGLQKTAKSNC